MSATPDEKPQRFAEVMMPDGPKVVPISEELYQKALAANRFVGFSIGVGRRSDSDEWELLDTPRPSLVQPVSLTPLPLGTEPAE